MEKKQRGAKKERCVSMMAITKDYGDPHSPGIKLVDELAQLKSRNVDNLIANLSGEDSNSKRPITILVSKVRHQTEVKIGGPTSNRDLVDVQSARFRKYDFVAASLAVPQSLREDNQPSRRS